MIFSQSCPNRFPFLLSSLPLKLHFGHFPYLSSIYVQFSFLFFVFLLRVPCLLDIFLIFLPFMSNFHFYFLSSFSGYPVFWIFSFSFSYMSNFHFYFLSSFSGYPVFWIFSLFFFHLCPIFHRSPTIELPIVTKFGYIAIRSALYVQSISVNT